MLIVNLHYTLYPKISQWLYESNISDTAQEAITKRILFLKYATKQVLTILPLKGRTRE